MGKPTKSEVSEPAALHKITHPLKRAFLAAFAECGMVERSAESIGIIRRNHYFWLETDADYRVAFEESKNIFADSLESEAIRRAREGVTRKKFDKGRPVIDPATGEQYEEREYSDTLLIFMLKGAKPDKYADRKEVNVKGTFQHEHYVYDHLKREEAREIERILELADARRDSALPGKD